MLKEQTEKICRILSKITLLIGILTITVPILIWNRIPEEIPSHYNAAGIPDQYSDKGILIFLLFAVAFLMGIMSIVVYYVKSELQSQYAKEMEKSQLGFVYMVLIFINFAIQLMFAYITFCCITQKALGTFFLVIALTAVFGPLFILIYKEYRYKRNNVSDSSGFLLSEKSEKGIKYRSKIDWWLGLLLIGTSLYMLYIFIAPWILGEGFQTLSAIISLSTLLILLPLFRISYTVYSDHLLIFCSIYGKFRIDYKLIRSMKETKNPLSSAALSLDRLQIDYTENGRHEMILISPVNKKQFIELLNTKIEECK